jgi:cytochrome c biogenesis protein CcmG/thiol:disulfide interchange protein DsbE
MLKNLILAFSIVIFAAIITFGLDHYFKTNRGDFFVLEQGQASPDFTFETIDGYKHSLSDFSDQTILIHFWASWCAPCVIEFPELIELAKKRDNVTILAFSSDRTKAAIDRFVKQDLPDNFKIIHDVGQSITEDKFSVFRLPETYIVKPDLILDRHIAGAFKGWVDLDL